MKPFIFNAAAMAILPMSAIKAKTAQAQIDAIYNAADDASTSKNRAIALARLAAKLMAKLNK